MKTNFRFTLPLLALAAAAFSGCSDDELEKPVVDPNAGKELMAFTLGESGSSTRASLSTRASMVSLGAETDIVMRFKSEKKNSTDVRYTRTKAKATAVSSCTDSDHSALGTHDHVDYASPDHYRFWDDAFGRDAQLSVFAVAVPGKTNHSLLPETILSDAGTAVDSNTNPKWFTNNSDIETFSWEVPSDAGQGSTTVEDYDICYSNNIRMRETNDNAEKGVYRYSYNSTLNVWSLNGMVAGRMEWTPKSQTAGETVGKFDKGHLIFKHALCKVTINLIEGAGFDNTSASDFVFGTTAAGGYNVEMLNFPCHGTFDIKEGAWNSYTTSTDIMNIKQLNNISGTKNGATTLTVTGLTLPNKKLWEDQTNSLHFVIDKNDYYVTGDQIAKAIRKYYTTGAGSTETDKAYLKNFEKMTQGEHYVINITVAKTQIEHITAQLIEWEQVNSALIDASNAYVKIDLEERFDQTTDKYTSYDNSKVDNFAIYRKASILTPGTNEFPPADYDTYYNEFVDYEWEGNYETAAATKTWDDNKNYWTTNWYWPNNLTYYHFRIVGDDKSTKHASAVPPTVNHPASPNPAVDYYEIHGGTFEATSSYRDYIWGAPFTNVKTKDDPDTDQASDPSVKFVYTVDNGFNQQTKDADNKVTSSQIYKAIGATNDKIKMMLFHMTSQIKITVKTTTDGGEVALRQGLETPYKQTKVELLRIYQDGTVLMGTGKVEPSGSFQNEQEIYFDSYIAKNGTTPAQSVHTYGLVPQVLSGTTGTPAVPYTVGLRITTPDDNHYVIEDISNIYVNASDITQTNLKNPHSAGTGDNASKYLINRWFPGYKYNYTVTISKTGIKNITAQLVDWETVTGDLGNINLEGTY